MDMALHLPPTIPRMNAATLWIRPFLEERITLIANHLLASEPVATDRMRRHVGRSVALQIKARLPFQGQGANTPALRWQVTAAGLLELQPADALDAGGLTVDVDLLEPVSVLKRLLSGQRPTMAIQGDAGFATDMAWLIDNLRWDVEDDLARVVGGPQAHLIVKWMGALKSSLQSLVGLVRPGANTANGQGAGPR